MENPVRLILWATPRTCSSILLKSFNNIPDSQMIFELYTAAYFFGPDGINQSVNTEGMEPEECELDGDGRHWSGFASSLCSYKWVKRQLEADFPSKRVIIAKEIAPWLNGRYDELPVGYQHAFLIRNPYKMFPSWKKLNQEIQEESTGVKISLEDLILDEMPPDVVPPGLTYKEIFDLLQYVKENNLDPDPIIIDSDDLVSHPAEVLSAVCGKVGIPYSDSLLSWEKGTKCVDDWVISSEIKHFMKNFGIFQNFRESTGFMKPGAITALPGLKTLSPDLQRCITYSMPYYDKMYKQHLKI